MKVNNLILICIVIFIVIGCSKTDDGKIPVARLDNSTLTLEDIKANIDTVNEPSQVQIQQYIQRWLTEESLYSEAISQGIDRDAHLNSTIDKIKRQLVINSLLEKKVYNTKPSDITKDQIHKYFEEHSSEFIITNDIAVLSFVLFNSRDIANEFRNSVLKGTSWSAAVKQFSSAIQFSADSVYHTKESLVPKELWRVAEKLRPNEVSFPINTTNGHYILILWKYFKEGQNSDITLVENEIRGRLTIEERRKQYENLVNKLRKKHSIEVFYKTVTDTTN